jgi:hypothetical protein
VFQIAAPPVDSITADDRLARCSVGELLVHEYERLGDLNATERDVYVVDWTER